MFGFLDILLLIFSLVVSVTILVPFTGVLLRFRANYNPKALRLDADGEAQAHTGPVVESYVGMFIRTWRIEGLSGMYKGLMPTVAFTLILSVVLLAAFDAPSHTHGKYRAPDTSLWGTLFYSFMSMVLSLPTMVITARSVTTPYRLPWFNAKLSLRYLLTPTERRKPWIIYLTPGLMASQVAHIFIVVCILGPLRRWLIPENLLTWGVELPSPFLLSMYITAVIVSTPILTPLEVIAIRLAIQRNHDPVEYSAVPQDNDLDDAPDYYAEQDDVIGLRSEEDPYLGLYDCFKRIVDEEGFRALYRAWWLTLLGGLGSIVS